MARLRKAWSDQQLQVIISALLGAGVGLASVIVLAGGIYYLIGHGTQLADYRAFHGEPAELRSLRGMVGFALSSHSRGIIEVGLLLLILTPVGRVLLSLVGFFRQRDRVYVVVTALVLAVLVHNLIRGML
jgi:uncharacterized membrane protein